VTAETPAMRGYRARQADGWQLRRPMRVWHLGWYDVTRHRTPWVVLWVAGLS